MNVTKVFLTTGIQLDEIACIQLIKQSEDEKLTPPLLFTIYLHLMHAHVYMIYYVDTYRYDIRVYLIIYQYDIRVYLIIYQYDMINIQIYHMTCGVLRTLQYAYVYDMHIIYYIQYSVYYSRTCLKQEFKK